MSGRVMAIARALVLSLPIFLGISDSDAAEQGFTTLHVDGEQVRIYRDEHGVPHIFAETNRALFVAYGHAVAEDRLWQLELFRRAARGRLAEILGPASVAADRNARTLGFTDDELDAQVARLTAEEQEIFTAYVEGINRYLSEVVALDPANKLPFEFHVLQIGVPAMWTVRDEIAVVLDFARRFGRGGGQELANQTLLSSLISLHCRRRAHLRGRGGDLQRPALAQRPRCARQRPVGGRLRETPEGTSSPPPRPTPGGVGDRAGDAPR
jgi:acyl-homoserine lactone acylase PvdQ